MEIKSLEQFFSTAQETLSTLSDADSLEHFRVEMLGKKGKIPDMMKGLAKESDEVKRISGKYLNEMKKELIQAIENKKEELYKKELQERFKKEAIDVTLSVPHDSRDGRLHPLTQTRDEIVAILGEMGFVMEDGPDIEDDFHNFTALNIPKNHPARQMHDTFYLKDQDSFAQEGVNKDRVLRTHTSPVQIRTLETQKPPLRVLSLGRAYRSDSDMTHTPMFHQVEGLVIDKNIHFGHLKGCLEEFCRLFFGVLDVPLRLRPSFFPFTCPSSEVDIGCRRHNGTLEIGNYGDWLEILGCGMVHPHVLKHCGLDPDEYQGFAFGIGVERLAMLKYGMTDLRDFFSGDPDWLMHYGFRPFENISLIRGELP